MPPRTAVPREEERPGEAIALHQQILTERQQRLGPDHPATLTAAE